MLRVVCFSLCLVPILAGATGLAFSSLDPAGFKDLLDSLAPDGQASRYDIHRAARIQERLVPAALAWIALGLAGALLLKFYGRQLRIGTGELLGLRQPVFTRLASVDRLDRFHLGIVFALTAFFAVLGTSQLGASMRCDEGAMYVKFASKPWYFIAATYGSTNNQILHTLLVHASTGLFGNEPWAIRLPSLLAGILLVPVYYWSIRSHFARSTALLATVLLATSTWILDQAVNARGYTMLFVVFFTLLGILPRLRRLHRWTWFSLVPLLTLGFYIVPIMLYPAAIVGVWLVFCGLFDVEQGRKLRFFMKVGIVYASAAILTIALYSPALVTENVGRAVRSQMQHGAHPDPLSQFADLDWRVAEFWESSTHGWPDWLAGLIIAGLLLGVFFSRRAGPFGNRLLFSTLIGVTSVLVVTGVTPPFWTVGFMLPLVLALAAAGLVGALESLKRFLRSRMWLDVGVVFASLVLAIWSGAGLWTGIRLDRVPWLVGYADAKAAAAFLEVPVRDGAKVDPGGSTPSSLRYYFHRSGLMEPSPFLLNKGDAPDEVYLVDTGSGEYGTQAAIHQAAGYSDIQVVKVLENSRIVRFSRPRAP